MNIYIEIVDKNDYYDDCADDTTFWKLICHSKGRNLSVLGKRVPRKAFGIKTQPVI